MKIFKKKQKISKGNKFLKGLNDAVKNNKDKKNYALHFKKIIERADKIVLTNDEVNRINTPKSKLNKFLLTCKNGFNKLFDKIKGGKFEKFLLKCKYKIDLLKEFINLIKCWFIVEYKIIRKLVYALDRKKDEVKIRVAFENYMHNLVNKYGYDRGMKIFYNLSFNLNKSIKLNKRVKKIGK